ncbi:MAG: hypothetical protein A2007_00905 [Verrucomicrobia bacterium GWC2_42_7]|nr:MAG: hypothetical protein A2007_00905 [Verrucomicrobia bacterium GWC2_42_7]
MKSAHSKRKVIGAFTLTMINVAAIISLRNLPMMAAYGLSMVFFYLVAALAFFIPTALVSAELATSFPKEGGIYAWVKEALGDRMGFLAIWIQTVVNVVTLPTVLIFLAGELAYAFNPALAGNKYFVLSVILGFFWPCTLLNLKGVEVSGWLSSIGSFIGTLFPAALIIVLAIIWLMGGHTPHIAMSSSHLVPSITNASQLVFLAGTFLSFGGIEMSGSYAPDVSQPKKSYPRAILLSTIIILGLSVFCSLAIAIVLPKDDIVLNAGIIQALAEILRSFNAEWLVPFMAILLSLGVVAYVSTWVAGPAKGLVATARSGELPRILQKKNKHGMPISIMIAQALVVTLFSLVLLLMPSVNASYWLLTVISSQVYLVMYLLMFITVVVLRVKRNQVDRPYKIPGGFFGVLVVASVGFAASLFGLFVGFVPPQGVFVGECWVFELVILFGILLLCLPPFLFHCFRKSY